MTGYVKRYPVWTAEGVAALEHLPCDDAARLDDEVQDRWAAQDEADARAREQHEERRKLDLLERRLRVQRLAERERRRRGKEGES